MSAARRLCALVILAALALTGCSDDDPPSSEQAPTSDVRAAMAAAGRAVTCPGGPSVVSAPLSGLGDRAVLEAFLLDQEADVDLYAGSYCLQVTVLDRLDAQPTTLTLDAAAGPASDDYAESYTTRAGAEGSDEITNFPFVVGVQGSCRAVTATLTLTDGSRHDASVRVGTGCPDGA